jgi:hypothetical protein
MISLLKNAILKKSISRNILEKTTTKSIVMNNRIGYYVNKTKIYKNIKNRSLII